MHALGHGTLPRAVRVDEREWRHERTVKHDFWAATGFYVCGAERMVLKVNRTAFPLRWVGRYLAWREARAYGRLADVPNVPRLLGRVGATGLAHAYAEGEPLKKTARVPDEFFDALGEAIGALNARGVAYVDLNKPQNVIVGADGRPYLIDFQIHFDARAWWPRALGRALLRRFHAADAYHVLKHKARCRPDLLTADERARVAVPAWHIRLHRALVRPYRAVRRPTMRWLLRTGRVAEAGSD